MIAGDTSGKILDEITSLGKLFEIEMFLLQHVNRSLEKVVIIRLLDDVLVRISLDQMVGCIGNLLIFEGESLVLKVLGVCIHGLQF